MRSGRRRRRLHRRAGPARRHLRTYAHFQNFRQAPFHRACANARNVNGSYSAVYVGNQPSAAAAEQAALAQRRASAGRKLATDPSSYRVYAVDDTILSTGQKIALIAADV